jgi:predicted glutamine amidotransferase
MCGLCGVARHPGGPNMDLVRAIMIDLLVANERRGSHATGIAVQDTRRAPWIFKRAVQANVFVKGTPFIGAWQNVHEQTEIILGHTRHATHQNAHEDDAAHPFQVGSVVGAHNGIIRNWRELEEKYQKDVGPTVIHEKWVNDSQAAFGMLDLIKDPVKATDKLDGYFALSWIKDGKLFLCRANSPELSAAYVPALQALFWSSEIGVLRSTLQRNGIAMSQYDVWGLKPGTIYRYDVNEFDEKGANGTKKDAPFRGISGQNRATIVNGANPNQVISTGSGGYSTQRMVGGPRWNSETATEDFHETTKPRVIVNGREQEYNGQLELPTTIRKPSGLASLGSIGGQINKVWDMLAAMNREIARLGGALQAAEGAIEGLRAENDHLYTALNETKPEVFEIEESPYKEAPCCGAPETATCRVCGGIDAIDKLLEIPGEELARDHEYVHSMCVLKLPS